RRKPSILAGHAMTAPSSQSVPGRAARLVAALALTVLTLVVVFVIRRAGGSGGVPARGPFDPSTTDTAELLRATEAISRVIAAPPDQNEVAVQTLETMRAASAGARDLKEACVNTYRGMIRAETLQLQLRGLALGIDGGVADAGEPA